jgi:heme/copper-type cytochrome/quinol oxidase subunit 3
LSIAHDVHSAPAPAPGAHDGHGPSPLDGKWSAPVGHALPTSTGLDNRKLLMWLFLASDCMFFGSLIGTFMVYKGRSTVGPSPHEIFDIPYTSVSAFVLLMSSLTMVLALAAVQRGDEVGLRIWLIATALLGSVFLGGQYYEFTSFYHEGMKLTGTNLFSSAFFTLTGTHGLHVTIGVIWLMSLVVTSYVRGIKASESLNVELAGLYWHFVDIVWIIIFAAVYLMGTTLEVPH